MNSNDSENRSNDDSNQGYRRSVPRQSSQSSEERQRADSWDKIAEEVNKDSSYDIHGAPTDGATSQTPPSTPYSVEYTDDRPRNPYPSSGMQDRSSWGRDSWGRQEDRSGYSRGGYDSYPSRTDRYDRYERRAPDSSRDRYNNGLNGDYRGAQSSYHTDNRPTYRGARQSYTQDDRRRSDRPDGAYRDQSYSRSVPGGVRRDDGYRQSAYRDASSYRGSGSGPARNSNYRPYNRDERTAPPTRGANYSYSRYSGGHDYNASSYGTSSGRSYDRNAGSQRNATRQRDARFGGSSGANKRSGGSFGKSNESSAQRHGRRSPSSLEPTIGALGKRGEPLSLAESLALKRYKNRNANRGRNTWSAGKRGEIKDVVASTSTSQEPEVLSSEVQRYMSMSTSELVAEARRQMGEQTSNGDDAPIVRVLREKIDSAGLIDGEGTLEILPDEFGFLRSAKANYLSCPDDIYISPSQIRRFHLRSGLTISGQIRPPKESERYFALLHIDQINGLAPEELDTKPFFDDLIDVRPSRQLKFEATLPNSDSNAPDLDLRSIDLVAPLAFGQRALLVTPPHLDKPKFLNKLIQGAVANQPDIYVLALLIESQPEDLTFLRKENSSPNCEIVGATFGEPAARHLQVSELVLEKAKRLVEYGHDVVLFVDSMTTLTQSWNQALKALEASKSSKDKDKASKDKDKDKDENNPILEQAFHRPRKLLSSSRQINRGGSLTIIGMVKSNEQIPEYNVIHEALQSFVNAEVFLESDLTTPSGNVIVNCAKSSVGDCRDFIDAYRYQAYVAFWNKLKELTPDEAQEFFNSKLNETASNDELFDSFNS